MPGYIHHIEWSVSDLEGIRSKLVHHYGFCEYATRPGPQGTRQVVLKSGSTFFLLTQHKCHNPSDPLSIPSDRSDTLFNVCLEIDNVPGILERASKAGAAILFGSQRVECPKGQGHVDFGALKSCVGNIIHSIVNTQHFQGCFLPGFEPVTVETSTKAQTSHIDHVSYVCEAGQSQNILEWYGKCFGMERFLVSPDDSEPEGVVIEAEVGLRLKVGEWMASWLCNETGAKFEHNSKLNFKLVLAEPLDNYPKSHVQNFLDEHGGPGLQHVGLAADNIAQTVTAMASHGAEFRRPPPTYFKMESKRKEIQSAGFDLETFRTLGLLLDTEADPDGAAECNEARALIQVFTKPMFQKDTFFMEIVQRQGANGFGAGNITALAKSIQLYQDELEENRLVDIDRKEA